MSHNTESDPQPAAKSPAGLLPWPRFRLKAGQVNDRWTGKQYRTAPAVLVGVLNDVAEKTVDAAAEMLTDKLGDEANLARELMAARQEAKDAYALVRREREACQDLAHKLASLRAEIDRIAGQAQAASLDGALTASLVKLTGRAAVKLIKDNPFASMAKDGA